MSTTGIPLPHPPTGGSIEEYIKDSPFYQGEFVFMRSQRISKEEVKRFYDLYGKTLPLKTWWSYLSKDYNKQIEFAKDADDDGGYYMFHTKYIGKVKEELTFKKTVTDVYRQTDLYTSRMFLVEWEAREEIFPGELLTRTQEHYEENLISLSKMTIVTKEEILDDTLKWAISSNNYFTVSATTKQI